MVQKRNTCITSFVPGRNTLPVLVCFTHIDLNYMYTTGLVEILEKEQWKKAESDVYSWQKIMMNNNEESWYVYGENKQ